MTGSPQRQQGWGSWVRQLARALVTSDPAQRFGLDMGAIPSLFDCDLEAEVSVRHPHVRLVAQESRFTRRGVGHAEDRT